MPPPPLPLAAPTSDRRLYRPPSPQLPPASRVTSAHPPLSDANPAAGDRCCGQLPSPLLAAPSPFAAPPLLAAAVAGRRCRRRPQPPAAAAATIRSRRCLSLPPRLAAAAAAGSRHNCQRLLLLPTTAFGRCRERLYKNCCGWGGEVGHWVSLNNASIRRAAVPGMVTGW